MVGRGRRRCFASWVRSRTLAMERSLSRPIYQSSTLSRRLPSSGACRFTKICSLEYRARVGQTSRVWSTWLLCLNASTGDRFLEAIGVRCPEFEADNMRSRDAGSGPEVAAKLPLLGEQSRGNGGCAVVGVAAEHLQKQALQLAMALLADPNLLVLHQPLRTFESNKPKNTVSSNVTSPIAGLAMCYEASLACSHARWSLVVQCPTPLPRHLRWNHPYGQTPQ